MTKEGISKTSIAAMFALAVVITFGSDRRIIGGYLDLRGATEPSSGFQHESVGKGMQHGDMMVGRESETSVAVTAISQKPPTKLFFPKKHM